MQWGEDAVVVADRGPLQDETVAQPAGEAHPDPRAGHRCHILLGQNRVVERSVQVAEREVDRDPGDGQGDAALLLGVLSRFGHTRC